MPTLPVVSVIAIAAALLACVLFVAGYIKGFSSSIDDLDTQTAPANEDSSPHYGWAVCLAVFAAAVVIVLLGVNPVFIWIAPFLSIASAAVIGALFFIEARLDRQH